MVYINWSTSLVELDLYLTLNWLLLLLLLFLPTRKNLNLWKLCQPSDCQFYFLPETLLNIVAGCKVYLEQDWYIWRHNSVLNFLATTLKVVEGSSLCADTPGFSSSSIKTVHDLRPDFPLELRITAFIF